MNEKIALEVLAEVVGGLGVPKKAYMALNVLRKAIDRLPSAEEAKDSARFVWWLSSSVKDGMTINEYLQGVREAWTVDQWRAFVDRSMERARAGEVA